MNTGIISPLFCAPKKLLSAYNVEITSGLKPVNVEDAKIHDRTDHIWNMMPQLKSEDISKIINSRKRKQN